MNIDVNKQLSEAELDDVFGGVGRDVNCAQSAESACACVSCNVDAS